MAAWAGHGSSTLKENPASDRKGQSWFDMMGLPAQQKSIFCQHELGLCQQALGVVVLAELL